MAAKQAGFREDGFFAGRFRKHHLARMGETAFLGWAAPQDRC
jgi:hypothetical protein